MKAGFWAVAFFALSLSFAGAEARAGEIIGFDFPVKTYKNDGAPDDHVLTAENIGVPYDAISVTAVRPNYKLVQIAIGDDHFNVRVEKVKFSNPSKYASLGRSVEWICPGGRSRPGQAAGRSASTRGLGVEPVCP